MGTCRPSAGIHLLGLARRSGSCRSCRSEPVSPVSVPLGTDADCGPLVTLRPFAPPNFHRVSTLLWPLLTPGSLSRARSPRVRTGTFDPCRQALPDTSFGDDWISRSLARSSPVSGLTACSCSCGRVLATPFFQLGLAASTLGFATLLVTLRGYLLSGNKYMPLSGTLGCGSQAHRILLILPILEVNSGRLKYYSYFRVFVSSVDNSLSSVPFPSTPGTGSATTDPVRWLPCRTGKSLPSPATRPDSRSGC